MRRHAATGSVSAATQRGGRRSRLETCRDYLVRRLGGVPDVTMPELAAELAVRGVQIDPSNLARWFIRNGYRLKKTLRASEQDRPEIRKARHERRTPASRECSTQRIVLSSLTKRERPRR